MYSLAPSSSIAVVAGVYLQYKAGSWHILPFLKLHPPTTHLLPAVALQHAARLKDTQSTVWRSAELREKQAENFLPRSSLKQITLPITRGGGVSGRGRQCKQFMAKAERDSAAVPAVPKSGPSLRTKPAWDSFLTEGTLGRYVALIPCIAAGRKKASSAAGVEHKSQGRTAGSSLLQVPGPPFWTNEA